MSDLGTLIIVFDKDISLEEITILIRFRCKGAQ
jgi:hypothetical protein